MAARIKYLIVHTATLEVLYRDLTKTRATSLIKTLNGNFKMVAQPPANKIMDKKALDRRQKDMDGFIEKHQDILDARAAKYAMEIAPQWGRIKQSIRTDIEKLYKEIEDANGVPITKQPIDKAKYRNMQRELERLRTLEARLAGEASSPELNQKLTNNLAYSYSESYYLHAFGLEQAAQVAVNVPVLTTGHVIGALINPWLPDGATYGNRLRANTNFLAKKMSGVVEEACGKGWSINRTAREIEQKANEGYYNAVRLARTEMTRAAGQGANHVYMQNADILDDKRWNATLDGVTSAKCAQCDGQVFPLDYDTPEKPGVAGKRIPNHPNCRCKWSPVLSALGISTRERIARDAEGKRTYTKARTYNEYAEERGLPNVDDRVRNANPAAYLRRGETLADVPKDFFDPFKRIAEVPTAGKAVKAIAAVEAVKVLTKDAFVPAKNVKEANVWAVDNLKHIKKVDYTGFDIRMANEVNEELYNLRQIYPEIEGINFVGTAQQRNKDLYERQYEALKKANAEVLKPYNEEQKHKILAKHLKKRTVASNVYAQAANESWGDQAGIAFNQTKAKDYDTFKKSLTSDVESKWHPIGTEAPVSVLIHEFGHSIDYFLDKVDLRDKYLTPITVEALKDPELGDVLSRYSKENHREVIAEAFAEYRLNPNPRKYARRVGEAIEQALEEYRRSKK